MVEFLKVKEGKKDNVDWASFQSSKREIMNLYFEKKYEEGLKKSQQLIEKFPEFPETTYFYTACFYGLLNKREEALNSLKMGMEKGAWWTSQFLNSETDLDLLKDDPRFIELGKRGDQILREEETSPELLISYPDNYNLNEEYIVLLILHWFSGNNLETRFFWDTLLKLRNDLILCFLQSSQICGKNRYCWDNWAMTRKEVLKAYNYLKTNLRIKETILAGVSQGATVAFRMTFNNFIRADRLILVIPSIKSKEQISEIIENVEQDVQEISTLIFAGQKDTFYQGALQLDQYIKEKRLKSKIYSYSNLGHSIPEDTIEKVNEFIEKNN
ncbi:MAG: TPR end-of-group domain-containing protein [Candidatus Heimdallarchaeaceae archaeon]